MSRGLIINGFAVLAAASLLASCIREDISEPSAPADGVNCISLQIITGPQTRADGTTGLPADKAVLNSVDLFFYTSDAGDGTRAVFKWHGTNATDDEKLNVSIPLELVDNDTLFGGNNQCKVYAVINSPEATALVNDATNMPTISDLRALKVTTAFFADKKGFDDTAGLVMFTEENPDPENRADGDTVPNIVSYDSDDVKATGHIYVNTPAAKIDLFVKLSDKVYGTDPDDNQPYEWSVVKSNGLPTAETHMVNGVKSVLLGDWDWTDESRPTDEDYFDTRVMKDGVSVLRRLKEHAAEDSNDYPYVIEAPFYTYPNQWASASIMELRRTTLLLKVDWRHEGSADALPTYYTVPLNLKGNKLEPNKYYRVKVNINTLGGANFGKPVELEPSVEVLEWGHAALEADIRRMRYLEVQQTVFDRETERPYTAVMNNATRVTIPFFTSHKTVISSIKIDYLNYGTPNKSGNNANERYSDAGTPTSDRPNNNEINTSTFTLTKDELEAGWQGAYIDELHSTITVQHDFRPMKVVTTGGRTHYEADTNSSIANLYFPYDITIVLAHDDDPRLTQTITIRQYPAVYVSGEVNLLFNGTNRNDTDCDAGLFSSTSLTAYGYAYVNGTNRGSSNYGGINGITKGWLAGLFDAAAGNPVMYIISVTRLDGSDPDMLFPFHVADPRNNLNNTYLEGNDPIAEMNDTRNWATTATSLYPTGKTNNQQLSFYYPTNESYADESRYALSPKYRIASGMSTTASTSVLINSPAKLNRQNARRRCAAYQEYGYPAGRWRLPTLGELQFLIYLNNKGALPELLNSGDRDNPSIFSSDVSYWTAQGLYFFNTRGEYKEDNSGSGYVRCVYDDWYWTKEDANGNKVADKLPTTGTPNYSQFVWGDKPKNNPQEQPVTGDQAGDGGNP